MKTTPSGSRSGIGMGEFNEENIQHRTLTFNIQCHYARAINWLLVVRCWKLDVFEKSYAPTRI